MHKALPISLAMVLLFQLSVKSGTCVPVQGSLQCYRCDTQTVEGCVTETCERADDICYENTSVSPGGTRLYGRGCAAPSYETTFNQICSEGIEVFPGIVFQPTGCKFRSCNTSMCNNKSILTEEEVLNALK